MISGATETNADADKLHQGVIDEFKATILTGTAGFVFGLPSALNLTFFGNQDFPFRRLCSEIFLL